MAGLDPAIHALRDAPLGTQRVNNKMAWHYLSNF